MGSRQTYLLLLQRLLLVGGQVSRTQHCPQLLFYLHNLLPQLLYLLERQTDVSRILFEIIKITDLISSSKTKLYVIIFSKKVLFFSMVNRRSKMIDCSDKFILHVQFFYKCNV